MRPVIGVIAVEEQPTVDGRLVRRHALTWDVPIPVLGPHPRMKFIGRLDEVERHGDYVLARGAVDDPRPVMPCGIDLVDVEADADYDSPLPTGSATIIIKRGRIHAVTAYVDLQDRPAWPGTVLLALPS